MLFLRITHYVGFIGAQINNIILLYLILTKARRLFGSYRHVMCTFAMYALLYSWIEILTQPIMHTEGATYIIYMDSSLKYEKWIGDNILLAYCGCFGLCISLLAAQFSYRYIVVCQPHFLGWFEGIKISLLFVPPTTFCVVWILIVYFGMANTVEKQRYFKDALRLYYDEDSSKVSFVAPLYWTIDRNGKKHWHIADVMSACGFTFVIIFCFSVIFICAVKTYNKLRQVRPSMSPRTRELNRQLLLTLTFQTALPLFMMYSPCWVVVILPILGVDLGRLANVNSACLGLYPSLEPLIAIFFIRDFRKSIFRASISIPFVGRARYHSTEKSFQPKFAWKTRC